MRILHVCWQGTIGGLEKYVLLLAVELLKEGHQVEVCVLHQLGPISEEIASKGIPVHYIGVGTGWDIKGAFRLKKFLGTHEYDMVHIHDRNLLANLVILLFGKTPRVFTEHGAQLVDSNPFIQHLFYFLLGRHFKRIIANSNYIRRVIIDHRLAGGDKVVSIYNGIDFTPLLEKHLSKSGIRKKYGLPDHAWVVGIVARMVPQKGIDLFLEVANELSKKQSDFVFVIVGDGPEITAYEKIARELSNVKVLFLGWQSEIKEIYPMFDVFLLTSRWEPFGITLLEAMIFGIPIVGFDVPGANEVVEKGRTALLVAPGDIQGMVREVLRLRCDRNLYAALKKNSRERVQTYFSIRTNVKAVIQIYKQVSSI